MNLRHSNNGFTLLELLVALAVFSVLSVMAYSGLYTVLQTRDLTDKVADETRRLQLAFHRMGADIEQAINRPVRDTFGESQPALSGGPAYNILLNLTRTGVYPVTDNKSQVRRVSYQIQERNLVRQLWPAVDLADQASPEEMILITGVDDVHLRFLDNKQQWHTEWPALTKDEDTTALPRAVEISITVDGWGKLRRLYQVSG